MPRLIWAILPPLLAALGTAAHAHGVGGIPGPGWTFDPSVTVPLALVLLLHMTGLARLLSRAERARSILLRRAGLFLAGWLVLALAVISPLHQGGERSFTLHMIEHELIMLVAAPLLAFSRPVATMLWALPAALRRGLGRLGKSQPVAASWRALGAPLPATALQAIAMWAWHVPWLFDRALADTGWHVAQHLSFLFGALLFWWAMVRTANHALAALCLFLTAMVGGALGALMALSASPWYAGYAAMGLMPFGLSPAEDQALAGLIMWVPGGLVHAGAALLLLGRYLGAAHSLRPAA